MKTYLAEELIPHRNEMLFVHQIFSLEPGVRATGGWSPSNNKWLSSTAKSSLLMPSMALEALAQLGACAIFAIDRYRGMTPLLAGFRGVKFPNQFCFDCDVQLSVEIISMGSRFGRAKGEATVEGRSVCSAELSFVVI